MEKLRLLPLRLNAGLHYVTVTDENGCTATTSVMMTETVVPLEVNISEKTKIKCAGEKAKLAVQVSGGKERSAIKPGTTRHSAAMHPVRRLAITS